MLGTYVDLVDKSRLPPHEIKELESKSWPCRVIGEQGSFIHLTGDLYCGWFAYRFIPHKPVYWVHHSGHDRWRFINNKMEWSRSGGPWELLDITPEQVDSWTSVERYNPLLYSDIIIKAPTYVEIDMSTFDHYKLLYAKALAGSQIRQDNYVVTIQMPSAEAARMLINFLESIK